MQLEEILQKAKSDLAAVTGLKLGSVIHASRGEDGWHVGVEMLELSRVPPVTDVLGQYEALLSDDGALIRFERKRTRVRGEPVDEE